MEANAPFPSGKLALPAHWPEGAVDGSGRAWPLNGEECMPMLLSLAAVPVVLEPG